jgi:coenzyme F420 hydrogenase subunit beta
MDGPGRGRFSFPFRAEVLWKRRGKKFEGKEMEGNRGLKALETLVFERDLCTMCGACAQMCPYLVPWKGRIVKLHDCDLPEGRCYEYCPRTRVQLDDLQEAIFGIREPDPEMGVVRRVLATRAKDPEMRGKAQTAGSTSAIVALALEEGVVDGALLTRKGDELLPEGVVVRDPARVWECAGSSYVASPTLAALNRERWNGDEKLAVVGIPCQILALAKMKGSKLPNPTARPKVVLTVGLFCTWALNYGPFSRFLRERFKAESILGMDITPPPERLLLVKTQQGIQALPLDHIRPFIRPTCAICWDMTSELADISIGTLEGRSGWNTLIVRTQLGEEILGRAVEKGLLEVEEMRMEELAHLKEASLLKKRRAILALKERKGGGSLYLDPIPRWAHLLEAGSEEVTR